MPVCKHCGSRITRFDKDICPVCGEKAPLEGVSSETVEITSNFNLNEEEFKTFRPCTRFKVFLLFVLLGWTGAPIFYMRYKLQAVLWLLINLVLIGGVGAVLAFLTPLGILWGFLSTAIAAYFINICVGIFSYLKRNLKDNRGEFLR